MLDLGEELYTQGRPHPMVDLDLRIELLERAAGDDGSAACCSTSCSATARTPTPRAGWRRAVGRAGRRARPWSRGCAARAPIPQDRDAQEATLRDAGVVVAPSNAAAARLAARAVRERCGAMSLAPC